MNGILPDLIQSFEECLKMVGGQGPYYHHEDYDAALSMTFILMQRKVFNKQERSILSMKLFEKCLEWGNIFNDVKKQVEFLEIASLYPETVRSEEHTSELQSRPHLVCRLLLEKK